MPRNKHVTWRVINRCLIIKVLHINIGMVACSSFTIFGKISIMFLRFVAFVCNETKIHGWCAFIKESTHLLYYSILRPSILHFPTFGTARKFVNTGAPSRNRRLLLKTPINLLLLLTKTVSTVGNYFALKTTTESKSISWSNFYASGVSFW